MNETAQIDFQQWAKENNIELVDIDSIDLKSVSETDAQLLNLAKVELEAMRKGKGGNPAAASDLVRWVDVIIGESSTYIDIDLPMNDKKSQLRFILVFQFYLIWGQRSQRMVNNLLWKTRLSILI